jgi:hypothetical protein
LYPFHKTTCSGQFLPLFQRVFCITVIFMFLWVGLSALPARADDMSDAFGPESIGQSEAVESGLTYLLDYCADASKGASIDFSQIDPLVAFVRGAEEMVAHTPRQRDDNHGAFIAYTLDRSMQEALRYAYNQHIPEGAINASSVRYVQWEQISVGGSGPPELWRMVNDLAQPKVVRGVVREIISPDLHTGAYYEYGLNRAFLLYRQENLLVMISISSQNGDSEVGRKGFIIGEDENWNYLYTEEPGLDKTGLGWVKSRIYDFYSICTYVEDLDQPGKIKIGIFQWLGAGWAGFNLVESHHIHKGMVRQTSQFKALLESQRMPAAITLEQVYRSLARIDEDTLRAKALAVVHHMRDKALSDDDLKKKKAIAELNPEAYVAQMDKCELISELMREFMKFSLGKETPLAPSFWVSLEKRPSDGPLPLS